MSYNTDNIILENNSLKSEIVNLHKKIINIEDQMKQIIEMNNNMTYELSKIMPYLKSFASDVSHDLHHIKYK
jgi:regulator of replication initiation timing